MLINGKTQLIGIFGHPISHTLSPTLHNSAYKHLKLNYVYVPLDIIEKDLEKALEALRIYNFAGINVTIPYKEKVIPYLDGLDPLAEKIGACNTIVNTNGRLIGYNTDAVGIIASLHHDAHIDLTGKHVCLIGAGGSAKAIAHALIDENIGQLSIINRSRDHATALIDDLKQHVLIPYETATLENTSYKDLLTSAHIVIQSTPVGMSPLDTTSPLTDWSWVSSNHLCYDIIYKPRKTVFLKEAEAHGAQILNGLGMLARQGAAAFELFTKEQAPIDLMMKEVLQQ